MVGGPKVYSYSIDPLPIQKIIASKSEKSKDIDIEHLISYDNNITDCIVTYKANLILHYSYTYWYGQTVQDSIRLRTSKLIVNNIIWVNDRLM